MHNRVGQTFLGWPGQRPAHALWVRARQRLVVLHETIVLGFTIVHFLQYVWQVRSLKVASSSELGQR